MASYDGETIELAFPPDRKVGPQKVEEKQEELRAALERPVRHQAADHVRGARVARPGRANRAIVEIVDEEDVPDEAEALRRVQEMLGAQPVGDDRGEA